VITMSRLLSTIADVLASLVTLSLILVIPQTLGDCANTAPTSNVQSLFRVVVRATRSAHKHNRATSGSVLVFTLMTLVLFGTALRYVFKA